MQYVNYLNKLHAQFQRLQEIKYFALYIQFIFPAHHVSVLVHYFGHCCYIYYLKWHSIVDDIILQEKGILLQEKVSILKDTVNLVLF